jgi:hypothetical protein
MRPDNNRSMGKRSRVAATRRQRRLDLEKSIDKGRQMHLRAVGFCVFVAMLSENQAPSGVVAWMHDYCHLSEGEAAESIAIGRRALAQARQGLSA